MKVRIEFETNKCLAMVNTIKIFHDDIEQAGIIQLALLGHGRDDKIDYQLERYLKDKDGKIQIDKTEFATIAMGEHQSDQIYETLLSKCMKWKSGDPIRFDDKEKFFAETLLGEKIDQKTQAEYNKTIQETLMKNSGAMKENLEPIKVKVNIEEYDGSSIKERVEKDIIDDLTEEAKKVSENPFNNHPHAVDEKKEESKDS